MPVVIYKGGCECGGDVEVDTEAFQEHEDGPHEFYVDHGDCGSCKKCKTVYTVKIDPEGMASIVAVKKGWDERHYSHYYQTYARLNENTPDDQVKADADKYPDATMTGYLAWLRRAWESWKAETGRTELRGVFDHTEHVDRSNFALWLAGCS